MYEELIEEVIGEVIRRISDRADSKDHKRKQCIVLGPCTQQQRQLFATQYEITVLDPDNAMSSSDIMSLVSQSDVILITKLTISNLCHLAQGSCDTTMETLVTDALLLGKEIFLLESAMTYHDFKSTASKNYYRKLLEQEETILNYGIKKKTEPELVVKYQHTVEDKVVTRKPEVGDLILDHRLITQKELMNCNFIGVQRLLIAKTSIVTPMAMDIIREHNLELIKY